MRNSRGKCEPDAKYREIAPWSINCNVFSIAVFFVIVCQSHSFVWLLLGELYPFLIVFHVDVGAFCVIVIVGTFSKKWFFQRKRECRRILTGSFSQDSLIWVTQVRQLPAGAPHHIHQGQAPPFKRMIRNNLRHRLNLNLPACRQC
jgi:hypothetical protein